ncbi:MAG: FecR domain-containing protein [Methylobacteriaceae bacterium]|nr:FecR domain-containing protein [Rhodoblastus sp.]MCC0004117.1 FecR domain-containing protein [Methylobacteriaceae bacterium]
MRAGLIAAALAGMALAAPAALAETTIGQATEVARNTLLDGHGARRAIERGDPVSANNTISTDAQGKAAFRFVDDTRLSVGPNSSVRLDRFVFDRDATPSSFVIRATKGLLRFSTGHGEHEAYRIQTPAATIGVRGTQFDVKIEGADVRVSVNEGEVVLCPNRGRPGFADCVECKAGFSILSSRTRARIVPTSSLPQIRADALLPLPTLASVLPGLPGLPDVGGVRQTAGAVGDAAGGAIGGAQSAAGDVAGTAGGVAGAVGSVGGGLGGAIGGTIGGLGGAVGGIGGGIGRTLGGLPRIGR